MAFVHDRRSDTTPEPSNTASTPQNIRWKVPGNRKGKPAKSSDRTASRSPSATSAGFDQVDSPSSAGSIPGSPNSDSLRRELIHRIESTAETGYSLWTVGNYIFELPARLGRNSALDASMRCLLSAHAALQFPDNVDNVKLANDYGRALRLLSTSISDSQSQPDMVEDVVAAAIILGDFEVHNDMNQSRDMLTREPDDM